MITLTSSSSTLQPDNPSAHIQPVFVKSFVSEASSSPIDSENRTSRVSQASFTSSSTSMSSTSTTTLSARKSRAEDNCVDNKLLVILFNETAAPNLQEWIKDIRKRGHFPHAHPRQLYIHFTHLVESAIPTRGILCLQHTETEKDTVCINLQKWFWFKRAEKNSALGIDNRQVEKTSPIKDSELSSWERWQLLGELFNKYASDHPRWISTIAIKHFPSFELSQIQNWWNQLRRRAGFAGKAKPTQKQKANGEAKEGDVILLNREILQEQGRVYSKITTTTTAISTTSATAVATATASSSSSSTSTLPNDKDSDLPSLEDPDLPPLIDPHSITVSARNAALATASSSSSGIMTSPNDSSSFQSLNPRAIASYAETLITSTFAAISARSEINAAMTTTITPASNSSTSDADASPRSLSTDLRATSSSSSSTTPISLSRRKKHQMIKPEIPTDPTMKRARH